MQALRIFLIPLLLFLLSNTWAQQAVIFGKVTDATNFEPIEYATIFIRELNIFTESDIQGNYRLEVPADNSWVLEVSRLSYQDLSYTLRPLPSGSRRLVNIRMVPDDAQLEIIITGGKVDEKGMIRERVDGLKLLPSASGNLESVLPSIALGTYGGTGGELTSQYNVRGGNYDENLVYVNDFEIYRPQLISSSQQEGLSFLNINLISNLSFSSGGFKSSYGDKMSSVLDIKYKRPDSLAGSLELSLLGAGAHVEGSFQAGKKDYQKIRFLVGTRYKTTRYLLSSLDTEGEYSPDFMDIQTFLTYDLHKDWQLGFIGNYNRAVYNFIPQQRSTALGLIDFALRLSSVFTGSERDDFTTAFGGTVLTYLPQKDKNPFFLKFMASSFQSNEFERFNILGFYRLSQIETGLGSDNFEQEVALLGTGTQHEYTRNFLSANVTNVEHKGGIELNQLTRDINRTASHFIEWGAKWQREDIDDQINEWERLDSAGYSLPYSEEGVFIQRVLKSRNQLISNRLSGFVQNTWSVSQSDRYEWSLSAGMRATYWDLNDEVVLSPRAQFLYKPLQWKRDISFKFSTGLYAQPPFYRELRNPQDGSVNKDLLSQKSFHLVGGMTWDFRIGNEQPKDFRFIAEVYYKKLWDLVSYEVDNVKIRYSGENDATGSVFGIDMRLNGEFVPGAESWINLSFLRARENLDNIQHLKREIGDPVAKEVSSVPRPTDQLLNLSMFFQDYLPKNENFKMHLNLTIGTGLPFGLKDDNREYRNTYRYSPYHRVDIGFSISLWDQKRRASHPGHFLRFTERTWLSLEIFNLLQVQNEASNTWIKTIFNTQYAIPNYLTSRRLNLRLRMDF